MDNISIHPRVAYHGPKKNTCAARSSRNGGQGGKTLRRTSKRLKVRQAAHATLIAGLPSSANPAAFRKPGSMKP